VFISSTNYVLRLSLDTLSQLNFLSAGLVLRGAQIWEAGLNHPTTCIESGVGNI